MRISFNYREIFAFFLLLLINSNDFYEFTMQKNMK